MGGPIEDRASRISYLRRRQMRLEFHRTAKKGGRREGEEIEPSIVRAGVDSEGHETAAATVAGDMYAL